MIQRSRWRGPEGPLSSPGPTTHGWRGDSSVGFFLSNARDRPESGTPRDFREFGGTSITQARAEKIRIDAESASPEVKELDRKIQELANEEEAASQRSDFEQAAKLKAQRLGLEKNVLFAGYQKDVKKIYRILDLYISASLREGLPNSVLEAQAMGIPCIVTDIPGNNDIIKDGRNGFLVKINCYISTEYNIKRP